MTHKQREFAKFAERQAVRWVQPDYATRIIRDMLNMMEHTLMFGTQFDNFAYKVTTRPGPVLTVEQRPMVMGGVSQWITFRAPNAFK